MTDLPPLRVKKLGLMPYMDVWQAMQAFTNGRDESTSDELWLVQHSPVFTQGQAGKAEHVLAPGDIPVVATDRGGQVTYHGPGQLVAYPLLDLRRLRLGVRDLVTAIENAVIHCLATWSVSSVARADAPGVYVDNKKIASLGLRVRRGCSFHGVSLNVQMDLEPFKRINPCGYDGLQMTQLSDWVDMSQLSFDEIENQFVSSLSKALGFKHLVWLGEGLKSDLKRDV